MNDTILHNENLAALALRGNQMIADGVRVFSPAYSPASYNQAMIQRSSR